MENEYFDGRHVLLVNCIMRSMILILNRIIGNSIRLKPVCAET